MRTVHSDIASRLGSSGETPIYFVAIRKTEGAVGTVPTWPSPVGIGGYYKRIFTTGTVGWTSRPTILANYQLHEDRLGIKSLDSIISKLSGADRNPGGLASIDSFKIKLNNTDGGLVGMDPAAAFVGVEFQGRSVEVGLTFDDITVESTYLQLFYGVVNDVDPGGDSVTLEVESRRHVFDSELPPNVFENETGELYPKNAIGKAIPLVFGSHDMTPGHTIEDSTDTGSADAGRRVKFCDTSDLAIDTINEIRFGDEGLLQAAGGYANLKESSVANLPDTTTYTTDEADGSVYFDDDEAADTETIYLYIDTIPVSPLVYQWPVSTPELDRQNPEYAIDSDEATFLYLENGSYSGDAHGNGRSVAAIYKLPLIDLGGAEIERDVTTRKAGVFNLFKADIDLQAPGGATVNYLMFAVCDKTESPSDACPRDRYLYGAATATPDYYSPKDPHADTQWLAWDTGAAAWDLYKALNDFSRYFFKVFLVRQTNATNTTPDTLELFEFVLRLYFSMNFPNADKWYADLDGFEDDGSGTITGTASALIENPLHVLGALGYAFNDETAAADVDLSGLQTVATDFRSGWKFARSLTQAEDWSSVVDNLSREAFIWAWIDSAGLLTATPWDVGTSGPDFTVTPADIEDGELDDYGISRIEEIVTDYTIKYKWNPVRSEYDGTIVCNASESSTGLGTVYEDLCANASWDNGGRRKNETFEFDWIRDETTAIAAAKKLVSFYTRRRWWAKFTADLRYLAAEIGDRVDFDTIANWPRLYSRDMIGRNYRISETRSRPGRDTVSIKLSEVL